MRKLLTALSVPVVLVAGLASPSRAVTNTTTVIRGSNVSNPQLTAAIGCTPDTTHLTQATNRVSPWMDSRLPTFPVPGLAPIAGGRYLSYSGVAGYIHGPMLWTGGANKVPTAVSAYVAEGAGLQSAVGMVIGWGTAPDPTHDSSVEYLGVTTSLASLTPSWRKVGFTTSSPAATSWKWFAYRKNSSGAYAWVGPLSYTLSSVEYKRSAWSWKAGIMVGCGDSAPAYVDDLAVTTAAGTATYDFEGNASSVSANVSPTTLTYGQPVLITARATAYGGAVPLRVVRCQGLTCQYVTDAITSSPAGPISFTVYPEPGWTYGVRYDGDSSYNPAQATLPPISVRNYLVAGLGQHKAHVGSRVQIGGQLAPCIGAARGVLIQRVVNHRWKTIGRGYAPACTVTGPSQFSPIHGHFVARMPGRWKVRIVAPASHGYAAAISPIQRLRVVKAPVRTAPAPVFAPPPVSAPTSTTNTQAPPPPS